jgi:hypothetical protein
MYIGTDSTGRRRSRLVWVAAFGCVLAGCSSKNVPAQPDLARQSLEATLASWKSGEDPAALARRSPSITVADHAWKAGHKLNDYRFLGDPTDDGVNLHYTVELAIADPRGTLLAEQVTYIVGTHPTITIFRD